MYKRGAKPNPQKEKEITKMKIRQPRTIPTRGPPNKHGHNVPPNHICNYVTISFAKDKRK